MSLLSSPHTDHSINDSLRERLRQRQDFSTTQGYGTGPPRPIILKIKCEVLRISLVNMIRLKKIESRFYLFKFCRL
jgi:hypothetical protein